MECLLSELETGRKSGDLIDESTACQMFEVDVP